ncbi:MAG: MBL fold metallo-hydrolase [Bacillota bacterium]|nr:MBL fold metallo-hydrolase [Bacillota bacterium]
MIETTRFGPVTRFLMGRVFDGKPLYTMACYYVDGLLIDTGLHHIGEEIAEAFKGYTVDIIVNTHHHEDHIGNNHLFQQLFDTGPALAHRLAVPLIINPDLWTGKLLSYQLIAWGVPLPSQAAEIPSTVKTPNYTFRVLHTPGHSDDHICLIEDKEGWLFSGDLYISDTVNVMRSDENVPQIIHTLEKLLHESFDTIYCASGNVVENGHAKLQAKYDYLVSVQQQVKELSSKGLKAEAIMEKLFGKESGLSQISEGDMSRMNLVRSLMGSE